MTLPRIQVGPHTFVNNPCNRSDVMRYAGSCDHFFSQIEPLARRRYEQLTDTLLPFDIVLTHVWAGTFTGRDEYHATHWVACDAGRRVFWQRYKSGTWGQGGDAVYVCGTPKLKLSTWLTMTTPDHAHYVK